MTRDEQYRILQACDEELLALQAAMIKSDAHASKCAKLGVSYKDTYPEEYEEYLKVNGRYNEVESEKLAALNVEIDEVFYPEFIDEEEIENK